MLGARCVCWGRTGAEGRGYFSRVWYRGCSTEAASRAPASSGPGDGDRRQQAQEVSSVSGTQVGLSGAHWVQAPLRVSPVHLC